MEQKFDTPPKAEIRLEGRRVHRGPVVGDWGMRLQWEIRRNGEVIATTWGLTQGRHYYGLFLSFESGEWGKYSPGRVLHHQLLLLLAERGYSCFDLGIGDEEWKISVCDVHIPLTQWRAAQTLRGQLTLLRMTALERLRQTPLWQRVRPLKWVLLRKLRPNAADADEGAEA